MKNIIPFENHVTELQEKKGGQWIAKAVGENPGALKRQLGIPKGEDLTKGKVQDEISKLKNQDTDPDKPGAQLPPAKAKKYKRLNLAKTLMGLKEGHEESENYMFFANIMNMKRMCDEILEMDEEHVDQILSNGHGWATDHIATSKDDVEEVYNFLQSEHREGDNDHQEVEITPELVISDSKEEC
jgi:hypothetical protein